MGVKYKPFGNNTIEEPSPPKVVNRMLPLEADIRQKQNVMIGFSSLSEDLQDDFDSYKNPHNPFISVEVSNPIWNNEGASVVSSGHRLYKIVTKLRDNPEFPFIQVHRRYSDLEWLMQALQVRFLACVIPPIPPKLNLQGHLASDDSELINDRREGIQQFLQHVIKHKILCGSEDLNSFLTGQDHEFEQRKAESYTYINSDNLNVTLSQFLTDGSHAFENITSEKTYISKGVKVVKKAAKKITAIGSVVTDVIWSGATYLRGGEQE